MNAETVALTLTLHLANARAEDVGRQLRKMCDGYEKVLTALQRIDGTEESTR